MSPSKKSKKPDFDQPDNQKPLSVAEMSDLYLYLSSQDPSLEVITRIDLQQPWKKLSFYEQSALRNMINGYSERETASIMGLSRRYIRDLKESGLAKLKEDL